MVLESFLIPFSEKGAVDLSSKEPTQLLEKKEPVERSTPAHHSALRHHHSYFTAPTRELISPSILSNGSNLQ